MKINDIKYTPVSVPYEEPEYWAWGKRLGATVLVIEVATDEGIVGLGESVPFTDMPYAEKIIDSVKPLMLNEDPFDIESVMLKIASAGYQHTADLVIAGLEIALWDIIGKACGKPLHKLLGGSVRSKIPFAPWLWIKKPEEMAKLAKKFVAQGFETFYIKVALDAGKDLERVKAVRQAVGENIKIRVDANRGWTAGEAVKMIGRLEKYDLDFVEDPTQFYSLKNVKEAVHTPVAAGENATTPYDVLQVINEKAADLISHIDPDMQGGIMNSKKACAICEMAGMPVVAHTGTDLGIGTSSILHLVASTPNFLYANQTVYMYLVDDLCEEGAVKFEDGKMNVPTGPGLGIELDRRKVQKYAKLYRERGSLTAYAGVKPKQFDKVLPPRFFM